MTRPVRAGAGHDGRFREAIGLSAALLPAVREVAVDALARGVGDPLPTNTHYLTQFGIGAGTMQRALASLEGGGALRTVSRGHLGRFITELDVGKTWNIAGLQPIRLLLPPRGPVEIDVLSAELAEQLSALGMPHTEHHERGGTRRVRDVQEGRADLAVVSAGVAALALSAGPRPPHRTLDGGTYYGESRLVLVHRAGPLPGGPLRIGIDVESPDHAALTRAEFPSSDGHEYLPCPFPMVPAAVLRGEIDAGIWHVTRTIIPLDLAGLATAPMRTDAARTVWAERSPAVLLGWSGRPELTAPLAAMDLSGIAGLQRAALDQDFDGEV